MGLRKTTDTKTTIEADTASPSYYESNTQRDDGNNDGALFRSNKTLSSPKYETSKLVKSDNTTTLTTKSEKYTPATTKSDDIPVKTQTLSPPKQQQQRQPQRIIADKPIQSPI